MGIGRMRQRAIFILVCFVFCFVVSTGMSFAGINLPWSTTFNCPDWTRGAVLNDMGCDSLASSGWACSPTQWGQITAEANNPSGGGGKGYIYYAGNGTNNDSNSNLVAVMNAPVTEFYLRYYIKYTNTLTYSSFNYHKQFYVDPSTTRWIIPDLRNAQFCIYPAGDQSNPKVCSSTSWGYNNYFNDNAWHWIEVHVKQAGGIVEGWIDGTKVISASGVNLGSTPWVNFAIGENTAPVSSSGCSGKVYYDDIAIQATGPIGEIGGGESKISAPKGVRIIQ